MARSSKPPTARPNVKTRSVSTIEKISFPFLKLPAELRNHVYYFVVKDPSPIYLNARSPAYTHATSSTTPAKSSSLSLLFVSHQVSGEALPVLLGTRTFLVANTPFEPDLNVTEALLAIGTTKLGLIRKMTFEINYCCIDHTSHWPHIFREIFKAMPAEKRLDMVKVVIADEMKQVVEEESYGAHWEYGVQQLLEPLRAWSGIKTVEFSGDLVGDYCAVLERDMMAEE